MLRGRGLYFSFVEAANLCSSVFTKYAFTLYLSCTCLFSCPVYRGHAVIGSPGCNNSSICFHMYNLMEKLGAFLKEDEESLT